MHYSHLTAATGDYERRRSTATCMHVTAWTDIICFKYLRTFVAVQYGLINNQLIVSLLLVAIYSIGSSPVVKIVDKHLGWNVGGSDKREARLSKASVWKSSSAPKRSEQDELPIAEQSSCIANRASIERDSNIVYYQRAISNQIYPRKNSNNKLTKFFSSSVILLLAFGLNDAPSCYGFGFSEHNHDSADYTNPSEYQSDPLVNPYQHRTGWQRSARYHTRNLNDDSLNTMPTPFGSLNLDQSSNESGSLQPTPAHSWTSIFNPFGGGNSNNNNNHNNNNGQTQVINDSLDKHIKNILVPRVSGTPGNVAVRRYIIENLKRNKYHVELDEFTDSTPIGKVQFANIIASSNPNACRQLVLACHYDSKMMDGFLGATDSAVPCAMLLKIAETSDSQFRANDSDTTSEDSVGLRFIFFDGEEAFVQWTHTDSLYGSRHLAAKWSKQAAPRECQTSSRSQERTELDRIDLFVLLDLIGAADTAFVQYNSAVRHHYEALQKYEKEHILKSRPDLSSSQIRRELAFKSKTIGFDMVEDDHVPFKRRGVPILLLLAHPFPRVWHTVLDNYNAIDFARTRRIMHALEQFVSNYS